MQELSSAHKTVASLIGETKPKGQDCPISSDPVPVFTLEWPCQEREAFLLTLHMPWSEDFSYSCDASWGQ